jgi:hypothetical protein
MAELSQSNAFSNTGCHKKYGKARIQKTVKAMTQNPNQETETNSSRYRFMVHLKLARAAGLFQPVFTLPIPLGGLGG